jgi:hypothetical protein
LITRRLVLSLGLSQLVCWGISYYLIAVFGARIGAELGWSETTVYGGFSAALLVMGLTSPVIGRAIDRHGGRKAMTAGSCLIALGCAGLGLSHGLALYYGAWLCLGVAMRLTLYDAAFAALARIGGPFAKRPISQITLLGGLASTVFWPIGEYLAVHLGWRAALVTYAGIALLTIPLHLAIPDRRFDGAAVGAHAAAPPLAAAPRERVWAGFLYALIVMLTTFLNSGMSAHMIGVMSGLGMGITLAVWIATLRGIGQSAARLCEVLFGGTLSPLALGVFATSLLPLSFLIGLASGVSVLAGVLFAFLYGAGNGLCTIVRGTIPLVLFDPRVYGALVGRLIMPSFFFSALSPIAYAFVMERLGDSAALLLSAVISALIALSAVALRWRFRAVRNP